MPTIGPLSHYCAVGRAVECDIPESLINELGAQQYQVCRGRAP